MREKRRDCRGSGSGGGCCCSGSSFMWKATIVLVQWAAQVTSSSQITVDAVHMPENKPVGCVCILLQSLSLMFASYDTQSKVEHTF